MFVYGVCLDFFSNPSLPSCLAFITGMQLNNLSRQQRAPRVTIFKKVLVFESIFHFGNSERTEVHSAVELGKVDRPQGR